MEGYEVVDMGTAEGRAKVAAYKAAKAEKVRSGQQLYAKIKRSSKYYGQGEKGDLFGRSPGSVRESERVAEEYRVDYVPKFILLAFLFWYLAAWLL